MGDQANIVICFYILNLGLSLVEIFGEEEYLKQGATRLRLPKFRGFVSFRNWPRYRITWVVSEAANESSDTCSDLGGVIGSAVSVQGVKFSLCLCSLV